MKKIVCSFVFGLMLMVAGAQAWADGISFPPPNPKLDIVWSVDLFGWDSDSASESEVWSDRFSTVTRWLWAAVFENNVLDVSPMPSYGLGEYLVVVAGIILQSVIAVTMVRRKLHRKWPGFFSIRDVPHFSAWAGHHWCRLEEESV